MTDKRGLQLQVSQAIKRFHADNGRIPSRRDLEDAGFHRHSLDSAFGTWTEALKACGLDPKSRLEITNKRIIENLSCDVADLLKTSTGQAIGKAMGFNCLDRFGEFKKVLVLGDLHCPWWSADGVQAVFALVERIKPDVIIQVGDSYDFFSFGRFPRSQLIIKPDDEVITARRQLEMLWKTIRSLAPKARLIQLLGNHCIRPMKKILASNAPELEMFLDIKRWFEFEGVETHHDTRTPVVIDDIAYIHGHLSRLGDHRMAVQASNWHGHTHRGGIIVSKVFGRWMFEGDAGHLADISQKCFSYTPVKEQAWSLGVGFMSPFGPHFIAL